MISMMNEEHTNKGDDITCHGVDKEGGISFAQISQPAEKNRAYDGGGKREEIIISGKTESIS